MNDRLPRCLVRSLPVLATIVSLVLPGIARAQAVGPVDAAPPQFLTLPLHLPEQAAQAVGGHLVYTPVNGQSTPGGDVTFTTPTLSSATLSPGANIDVSNALDSYQGEPMLMSKGSSLVGGYNSIYPGACSAADANCAPGATASANGTTWTTSQLPITVNGHSFLIGFDPSIAVDAGGTFYYCYGVADSGNGANAIAVASSTDGANWTPKTPVAYTNGGAFDDKYWIAADRNKTGTLYVGWDRNKGNNQTLFCAVSTDGGDTWTAPIKVNDGKSKFERVIYAFPAVDPRPGNGTVYIAWLDYAKNIIFVDKSTNGGLTWGTDVAAATTHIGFGTDIGCNGGRTMTPAPQMGIDGNGAIYLSYADKLGGGRPGTGGTGYDIFLVKSTDGGAHWSAPKKLNDDTGSAHQYNPAISVLPDTTSTVYVSWYDRRNDSGNCLTDIYSTVSIDGGASFAGNARVTPISSNYDGNPNGPGDYSGNAPVGTNSSFPLWCSHLQTDINQETGTAGGFEIYTAAVAH